LLFAFGERKKSVNKFFKFMFAFGKPNFRLSGQKLFLDFKNPFKILAEAEPRLWRGEATIAQKSQSENWRKGWDSNPQALASAGFSAYGRSPEEGQITKDASQKK